MEVRPWQSAAGKCLVVINSVQQIVLVLFPSRFVLPYFPGVRVVMNFGHSLLWGMKCEREGYVFLSDGLFKSSVQFVVRSLFICYEDQQCSR